MYDVGKSIEQALSIERFNKRNVNLFIKRDDLIDNDVSGNKWRKLKYNIEHVVQNNLKGILTFGGAFSNHLLAVASACNKCNLKSIGIVRGEELNNDSNFLIKRCKEFGMEMDFVSRETYRLRNDYDYRNVLKYAYPEMYIVPEGGANYLGMIGCQEILKDCKMDYDHVFLALGTGTTAAGITSSLRGDSKLHVVAALKGSDVQLTLTTLYKSFGFSDIQIKEWLQNIVPHENSHWGGYGKTSEELITRIIAFKNATGIDIDPIYTGKVWTAMEDWIERENISNSNVLFIHTGGVFGGHEIISKLTS
jgi:1-aminocyclopropane-1-carboxylate deaminase